MDMLSEHDVLLVVQSMAHALGVRNGDVSYGTSFFPVLGGAFHLAHDQREALAAQALQFFAAPQTLLPELTPLTDFRQWATVLYSHWDKHHLCFSSSGSTGEPRIHCFTVTRLLEELQAAAPMLQSRSRIVSIMPVHHIFGHMYGPLLARFLGIPLITAPALPLASFFQILRPGDLVTAFPSFWQALLHMILDQASGQQLAFPENLVGLTATSPCPRSVTQGLLRLHESGKSPSLVGVKEVYGSTETNGVGMRHEDGEWFELFSCWISVPQEDGSRAICRLDTDGQKDLTEQRLPDIVQWHDARRFIPQRRVDNAVQVGGMNVYPERVAVVLRSHPLVRDCAVRLMRPDEGTRLKAFIVPAVPMEQAAQVFGKSFRNWMESRLNPASRPKRIRLGESLPINAIGKAQDWD